MDAEYSSGKGFGDWLGYAGSPAPSEKKAVWGWGRLWKKLVFSGPKRIHVKRDDVTGSIVISGYPGAAAEVQDILDRLQLDPNLLLGY